MKIVRENIGFKRGQEIKKTLGIGQIIENRDPIKLKRNFVDANPEVDFAYSRTSNIIGVDKITGMPYPKWEILSFSIRKNSLYDNLSDGEKKYKKWFESYTDFDIVIISSFERKFFPFLNSLNKQETSQNFKVEMRNVEDDS